MEVRPARTQFEPGHLDLPPRLTTIQRIPQSTEGLHPLHKPRVLRAAVKSSVEVAFAPPGFAPWMRTARTPIAGCSTAACCGSEFSAGAFQEDGEAFFPLTGESPSSGFGTPGTKPTSFTQPGAVRGPRLQRLRRDMVLARYRHLRRTGPGIDCLAYREQFDRRLADLRELRTASRKVIARQTTRFSTPPCAPPRYSIF